MKEKVLDKIHFLVISFFWLSYYILYIPTLIIASPLLIIAWADEKRERELRLK